MVGGTQLKRTVEFDYVNLTRQQMINYLLKKGWHKLEGTLYGYVKGEEMIAVFEKDHPDYSLQLDRIVKQTVATGTPQEVVENFKLLYGENRNFEITDNVILEWTFNMQKWQDRLRLRIVSWFF